MKITFKTANKPNLKLRDLKDGDIFAFSNLGTTAIYQKKSEKTIIRLLDDKLQLGIREEAVSLCLVEPVVKYEIEEIILRLA